MEQNDALDQAALSTVIGAQELMQWFRQEGYTNRQAFCIMTHASATLFQSLTPTDRQETKEAAVIISRRIFQTCNESVPMAGARIVEEP